MNEFLLYLLATVSQVRMGKMQQGVKNKILLQIQKAASQVSVSFKKCYRMIQELIIY